MASRKRSPIDVSDAEWADVGQAHALSHLPLGQQLGDDGGRNERGGTRARRQSGQQGGKQRGKGRKHPGLLVSRTKESAPSGGNRKGAVSS